MAAASIGAMLATGLAPAPVAAHTNALGFVIIPGTISGRYNATVFYGTYHAGAVGPEGSVNLTLNGSSVGQQAFAIVPGYSNVLNATPTSLVAGTNYFFVNASNGPLQVTPPSLGVYSLQSATFDNLDAGDYSFGYVPGTLSAVWTPYSTVINAGTFTITSGGNLGGVGGVTLTPNIDATYTTTQLAAGAVNPAFTGGTLTVSGAGTVSNNFTVNGSGTINGSGLASTFSGVISNGAAPGGLTLTGGGTVAFGGVNTFTGGIVVNGAVLQLNNTSAAGTGTIHMVDPTINFNAAGTYANDISLEVAGGQQAADPTVLNNASGGNITLTGRIHETAGVGGADQYVTFAGGNTTTLTNGTNAWGGVTTVNAGVTLAGTAGSISGGSIVNNGTLDYVNTTAGTVSQNISGSGQVNVSGLGAGQALTFAGTLTNANGIDILDGSAIVIAGDMTTTNGPAITSNAAGISVTNLGSMSANAGSPLGTINLGLGGTIINGSASNNTASITGGYAAIYNTGGALNVTNYGSLDAAYGVVAQGGNGANPTSLTLVNSGTIRGGDAAVVANDQTTVNSTTNTSTGLIQGNNTGVFLRGTASLNNAGDIVGGTTGVVLFNTNTNSLTNSGRIASGTITGSGAGGVITVGGGSAVEIAGGTVNNLAGGQILGNTNGVNSTAGTLTLTNAGLIRGQAVGVRSTGAAVITNQLGGSIIGVGDSAIYGSSTLTVNNAGLIRGGNTGGSQDGISAVAGLTLTNSGTINTLGANAGVVQFSGVANIDNLAGGVITGGSSAAGYALNLSGGTTGSIINRGTLNAGSGTIYAVRTTGATTVNLTSGSVTNGGVLAEGNGARNVTVAGTLNGTYNAASGSGIDTITLASTGSMTTANLGAGNDAFLYQGGTFSGLIDGGSHTGAGDQFRSVLGAGSASISLNNMTGFETYIHESGNLTLTGSRSGGVGWQLLGGSLTLNGSLTNTGVDGLGVPTHGIAVLGANATVNIASGAVLWAQAQNAVQVGFVDNFTLNNSGTVGGGTGFAGVRLNRSATINNYAGGLITSSGVTGASGISNSGASVVVNNASGATITGNYAGIDNVFGIEATAPGLTVFNSGSITTFGTSSAAVRSGSGTLDLLNYASGTISGFEGVSITGGSANIHNFGTISGGVSVAGAGSVQINNYNGGVIASAGAGGDAIRLLGSNATVLYFTDGSTITGDIDAAASTGANQSYLYGAFNGAYVGGSGVDNVNLYTTATGTFSLDGGAGTSDAVNFESSGDSTRGGSITNFEIARFNGTGTVTLTGTNTGFLDFFVNAGTVSVSTAANMGDATGRVGLYGGTLQTTASFVSNRTYITSNFFGQPGRIDVGAGTTFGIAGGLQGNGHLMLGGAGTLNLLTTNSGFSGDIYVNGSVLRAGAAGAFGTGTIHLIDPTLIYGASGTYANNILLEVQSPASSDPSTLNAEAGVTATLTGSIRQGTGAGVDALQPLVIGGTGRIVLANTANLWAGTTTINVGATLQGTTGTISGSNTIANGVLHLLQPTSGTFAQNVSGSGTVQVSGLNAGQTLTLSGALTNANGVQLLTGNALNITGSVSSSTSSAVFATVAGATITNSGTITGNGTVFNSGVRLNGAGTVTNLAGGTIRSNVGEGINAVSSSVFNAAGGTISGALRGVFLLGANASVDNSGTISGGTLSGLTLNDGGVLINRAGGLINTVGGHGVVAGLGTSTITNAGSIQGVSSGVLVFTGGSLTNTGTISGATGVNAASSSQALTLISSGTITGTGGTAIAMGGQADIVDLQSGSVTNGSVFLGAGGDTLTLAGSLNDAVDAGAGADLVTLLSGSSVTGLIDGGADVDSFVLSGGGDATFDVAHAVNFENRSMNGAGTWTLTGVDASTAAWAINSGVLAVSGGFAINDASDVTIAGGATLALLNDETIGSLAGSGLVDLASSRLTLAGATSTTFDGILSGSGGLTVGAANSLTLSGANTYTGTTSVEGVLTLGTAGVLADGSNLLINTGGVVDLQAFDETVNNAFIIGVLDGTGTLTAGQYQLDGATVNANLGTGLLFNMGGASILNGVSAASTVAVFGGTLTLGASDRLADSATLQVSTGATLDLQGFDETVDYASIYGVLNGTGTLNSGAYDLDGGVINANLGAGFLRVSGFTGPASVLNGTVGTNDISIQGPGTLQLGASDRIIDTATVSAFLGGSLDIQGFNETIGTLLLNGGSLNGTGTLTAGQYVLNGATVNANLGAGDLFNTGGVSMLNGTAGAANVAVLAGTLTLGASDRLADAATVSVASGATFDLGAFSDRIALALLNGTLAGTGTLTAGQYQLNGATVNANFGAGDLFNTGGVSTLNGVSGAGLVSVQAGTLTLGASNRLADTATVSVASGATFNLGTFNDTVALALLNGTLAGSGRLTAAQYQLNGATVNANLGGGDLFNTGGVSTLNGVSGAGLVSVQAGTLTLGASNRLADTATVSVTSGATFNLGAFNDTVSLALLNGTLAGTGTLTAAQYQLNGATVNANLGAGDLFNVGGVSTLNGTAGAARIWLNAGTLRLGASERLSDTATVSVATGATFALNGFDERIGALFGTGDVNVGAGRLTFGGSESGFGGRLSGTGTLVHTGGLFTLMGNHSIRTISNTGGELRFLGTTTGNLSISGGGLTGAGTIGGALTASNGAILSPGLAGVQNGIGGFSAGSLTLNGATLAIDVLGRSGGRLIDQLRINGTATLTGGLLSPTFQGGAADFDFSTRYLFLQANNLVGTFANGGAFTAAAQPGLFWRVRYDLAPNAAVLELRELTDFDPGLTGSGNERAVGRALSQGQLEASDDFAGILSLIAGLDDAGRLAALNSISGEPLAGMTTSLFSANDRFLTAVRDGGLGARHDGGALNFAGQMGFGGGRDSITDRVGAVIGDFDPLASTARGGGGWVAAYAADQALEGKPGTADLDTRLNGFAGGYGVRNGSLSIGGAAGVTRLEGDVVARQSDYESELSHAAAYVSFDDGVWAADVTASIYGGDLDSRRGVTVGTFTGQAVGNTHAEGQAISASVARRFQIADNTVIALGAVGTASNASVDGFTETGAGGLSLQASGLERDWQSLLVSARGTQDYRVDGRRFRIYAGAGVLATTGDRQASGDMRFTGAPTGFGAFTVEAAETPPVAGVGDFGLEVGLGEGLTLSAGYRGVFGERLSDNQIGVQLKANW